ncbi:aspartate aminotransferase family protein [Silvibacterium sp.]|uniref:aspartate aminotransferase family protein n=1 Tax=Silvibacterium sp. TaxID=1964179 RepID=UPI0039E5E526
MTLEEIQAAEAKLLLSTYERNPIHFVSGEGVYLVDEKGERYLDLLSGIGVNALGYAHPVIEKAIVEQSRKLIHTSNLFFHEGQAELALRLTQASGMDRAFFSNSGTEAWEAALKLARAHAGLLRSEGRTIGTKFLALEHSFHGRTMGSVATTHKAKYREPFEPVMGNVEFVAFNNVADLTEKFSTDVCAIVLEAIQGEGGIRPVSREFLEVARALTQSTGALLIVDEIQAGFGRTGKWFAYQNYSVQPDVTTVAKPLAGGLPLGAMFCTEEAARAIHPGMHGTTFGGGPLACAVAIAVFDEIEKTGMLEHITEVGAHFQRRLNELQAKHPAITEVRGKGLMLAAELDSAELAKAVLADLLERKILINRTSETVLRFLPPYILNKEQVDVAVDAIDEILTERAPQAAGAANEGGTNVG